MKYPLLFLALFSSLHAEEVQNAPPEQSFWHTIWMLAFAGLLFYFILFRPEQKRRKEMEKIRSELKVGDKVNVIGIIGFIAKIEEETLIVRMYDGSKLEFVKGAVSEVLADSEKPA
ncbi:MAG: preprotein translocase subunit YajC [Chlamydiia bacterium]|nr:preprotein translocase subunit YajC [Chlamydiia bacterium]